MRILFAAVAIFAGVSTAVADEARMSKLEFSRAVECLAYSGFDQMQANGPDLSALEARLATELELRPSNTRNEVKDKMYRVRMAVGRPDTASQVARVSALRDRACRRFVDETTTAARPEGAPASP